MNKQQIIELLSMGENHEIEFKEAKKKLPKSLWSIFSICKLKRWNNCVRNY